MTSDLTTNYAKAESMQAHKMQALITSFNVEPGCIDETERFWYRNQTVTGHEFVLVDAVAGTRHPAFDHERLAKALGATLEQERTRTSAVTTAPATQ